MVFPKHKFLIIGIVLALLIGGGLAALNQFVRAENNFHEADMALAARAKPATPPAQSTATGSNAPTSQAPPPR